jgi:hypothetical protein
MQLSAGKVGYKVVLNALRAAGESRSWLANPRWLARCRPGSKPIPSPIAFMRREKTNRNHPFLIKAKVIAKWEF